MTVWSEIIIYLYYSELKKLITLYRNTDYADNMLGEVSLDNVHAGIELKGQWPHTCPFIFRICSQ